MQVPGQYIEAGRDLLQPNPFKFDKHRQSLILFEGQRIAAVLMASLNDIWSIHTCRRTYYPNFPFCVLGHHVDFIALENLTAVVMKITISWYTRPCCTFKVNRRLGRKYRYSSCHLLSRWYLSRLIFRPWNLRWYVPPKRRVTFSKLHGVMSKNTVSIKWIVSFKSRSL
jgi:hypothetical protein